MDNKTVLKLLSQYESPNVTFMEPDGSWPIVWEKAHGVHVWDANGKKYLDLTAAFGVAAAGHANPAVVKAGRDQMAILTHAMGDVHPHGLKAQLARELSRLTFERWSKSAPKDHKAESKSERITGKSIFCNSGFEAVEAALKTAILATGRRGIIAFEQGYHGLGYGTLNATHRSYFRAPFRSQLGEFGRFVPYPEHNRDLKKVEHALKSAHRRNKAGAVLVEPIQGRGGIHVPPPGFLPLLRRFCDDCGALLILDEIYTGFGRTGRWFACEHSGVIPDLICLGKALTGGFPLSACVGKSDIVDTAWPVSTGEALHTSTFLGHPVGCAMALAQITEIRKLNLVNQSKRLGEALLASLTRFESVPSLQISPRGLGLMAGLELRLADGSPASVQAMQVIKQMLQRGFILLPEGEHGNVIGFTPPLTITAGQLDNALENLASILRTVS